MVRMTVTNILANLFASLQNAEMRRKKEAVIIPASNLASEVMRVLQKKRYIGEFEFIDDGVSGKLQGPASGTDQQVRGDHPAVSQSRRRTTPKWESRYLPAVGVGMLIVSTPEGVLSHTEAQEKNIGGRLLGYVY